MDIPNKKYFSVNRRRGESPVSHTPLENPENPLNPNGSGGGAEGQIPPVSQRYDSESEMIADQGNQRSGFLYFDGTNTWWYLGGGNGVIGDYFLFANGDELATLPHNSTTGKQGGDPVNDFYGHVTADQIDKIDALPSGFEGIDEDSVHYNRDDAKTEPEKQQARENIDVYSISEIDNITGDRDNLNTYDKSNLVVAINIANSWGTIEF